MENPQFRQTAIGGTIIGPYHIHQQHKHSCNSKQHSEPVEWSRSYVDMASRPQAEKHQSDEEKVYSILEGLGIQESLIQQAIDISRNKSTNPLTSENLLDIIYTIEDEAESGSIASTSKIPSSQEPTRSHQAVNFEHQICIPACGSSNANKDLLQESPKVTSESTLQKEPRHLPPNEKHCHRLQNKGASETIPETPEPVMSIGGSILPGDTALKTNDKFEATTKEKGYWVLNEQNHSTASSEEHIETVNVTDKPSGNASSIQKKNKKKRKKSKSSAKHDSDQCSAKENSDTSNHKETATSKDTNLSTSEDITKVKTNSNTWTDVRPKETTSVLPKVVKNRKTNEDITKLVEENRKLLASKICHICKANPSNLLLLPCRHLACCESCGESCEECPRCGKQVIASVKVFMA